MHIALTCASCRGWDTGFVSGSAIFASVCILHNPDISFLNELSNHMIPPEYVLILLVLPWFIGLCNSTIIVIVHVQ